MQTLLSWGDNGYCGVVCEQGLFCRSRHWDSKGVEERVAINYQCQLQLTTSICCFMGAVGAPSMTAKGTECGDTKKVLVIELFYCAWDTKGTSRLVWNIECKM